MEQNLILNVSVINITSVQSCEKTTSRISWRNQPLKTRNLLPFCYGVLPYQNLQFVGHQLHWAVCVYKKWFHVLEFSISDIFVTLNNCRYRIFTPYLSWGKWSYSMSARDQTWWSLLNPKWTSRLFERSVFS